MTYKQHRAFIRKLHVLFAFATISLIIVGISLHSFWSALIGVGVGSTFYVISSYWIYRRDKKERLKSIEKAEKIREQIMSMHVNSPTPDDLAIYNNNVYEFNKLADDLGIPPIVSSYLKTQS